MIVLGIETSCDECSASLVQDGKRILSNVIATQLEQHRPYNGVVPELASRTHTEWIVPVVRQALKEAGLSRGDLDGIAVTGRPGLVGSLMVGLSYAKALSYALGIPYTAVDHIRAHLYAARLETEVAYPYLGLLVSGGHTIICRVDGYDQVEVLGTTIDDACGEAFDKIAKHYGMGYPGGAAVDRLAQSGDSRAFRFPAPSLHKGEHRYDVSYSGLKTAVINQLEQFRQEGWQATPENIAAAFQKSAIDMLTKRLYRAVADTGLHTVVAGGGVAANSYLRRSLLEKQGLEVVFPSMPLCTDNGAMIAGIGYHYLKEGRVSGLSETPRARVAGFKKKYP